ncbi:hypothetical protein [Streptomyces zhaozhouensis]|uniref:hypothetical protein n=1 Tax=Streptomyces zhaozhouensis TaxID=1300267 RepID=UPI0034E07E85
MFLLLCEGKRSRAFRCAWLTDARRSPRLALEKRALTDADGRGGGRTGLPARGGARYSRSPRLPGRGVRTCEGAPVECPSCGSAEGRRLNNGNWVCEDCGSVTAG